MTKDITKFRRKTRRKPEYTKEGMAQQEEFERANRGNVGMEIDPVITGGPKRGHGRGKASDAGPPRKRKAA